LYQWQAPISGLLILTNSGSSGNPVVGVYLGTNLNELSMIGDVETPVRSGEAVHILVDQEFGQGGVIQLGMTFLPAPTNDDFEQATSITGTDVRLQANVRNATGQSTTLDDRFRYDFRDVWWAWTAPAFGAVVISNLVADANPTIRVFTGKALTNLEFIGTSFSAVAGATYYIEGTWGPGADSLDLHLVQTPVSMSVEAETRQSAQTEALATVVAASQIQLDSPHFGTNGVFVMTVTGPRNAPYQLECSSDLVHWNIFKIGLLTTGIEEVIDKDVSNAKARFSRLR